MTKRYEGRRARQYETEIIVHVDGDVDSIRTSAWVGLDITESRVQAAYPLPFVDRFQWERVYFDADIPRERPGHEWGYVGTGPSHTAASILADLLGDPQSIAVVQQFHHDVVAGLGDPRPGDRFVLAEAEIRAWLQRPQVVELIRQVVAEVAEHRARQ